MTFHAPLTRQPLSRGKTVAQIMAEVLGAEDAATWRPSDKGPSLAGIAASEHDVRMGAMVSEMSAAYAARGHAK